MCWATPRWTSTQAALPWLVSSVAISMIAAFLTPQISAHSARVCSFAASRITCRPLLTTVPSASLVLTKRSPKTAVLLSLMSTAVGTPPTIATKNSSSYSFSSLVAGSMYMRVSAPLSGTPLMITLAARTRAPGFPSLISTSRLALVHELSPRAFAAAGLVHCRKLASKRLFSSIQRMKAIARAPSVPGRTGRYFHALLASLLKRGSATAIFVAPVARFWVSRVVRLVGP